jgi:mono/diheme cytochrome c family protein
LALGLAAWVGTPHSSFAANVHSIELPHLDPELPVAAGQNEYMTVCVSCHSPRYVMMQPPFTQRQWEQTVDKMIKNYGAQVDSAQRTAIVGYLVTVHGPNWTGEEPARSDDEVTPPVQALPSPAQTPPPLPHLASGADGSAELRRGESLFAQNCAACHGAAGRGDGMVAAVLLRQPKNLAATRFSTSLLAQVLWNGKPGTAMPSWRNFPPADLAALAACVQSFHRPFEDRAPSPETLQQGANVFALNCAPCHGPTGEGNGTAAASLLPQPANFRLKQPDPDYIVEVLRDGIPGTGMPSWKEQISTVDREALAAYVRSLFEPEAGIGR